MKTKVTAIRFNYLTYITFLAIVLWNSQSYAQEVIQIDADFPGGNIIVDGIDRTSTLYYTIKDPGKIIQLRPDLRDTQGDWFYWYFRIKGAAGKKLTFKVPRRKISDFGPAVSSDGGKSWKWLYDRPQTNDSTFSYSFGKDENEVRFSIGMAYLEEDFDEFMEPFGRNKNLTIGSLTVSPKGRNVEKLLIHNPETPIKYKMVITARHHACEMMASYVLEGMITSILTNNGKDMAWMRDNVEFLIVPFVDKDGVQDGDQGKNRMPRDHNRDYSEEGIYNSPKALRALTNVWGEGKLRMALDLHCPGLNANGHEFIHQVGSNVKHIEQEQIKLDRIIAKVQEGELKFDPKDFLKYGTSWNVATSFSAGRSFRDYYQNVDGVVLATTLEFPYANANLQMVTRENARAFGKDLAKAIAQYFQNMNDD